jgi:crossover junction endodeoxyribonuclease RuvC
MGVDPGSLHTGYGVIEIKGDRVTHLCSGRISPKSQEFPTRLRHIFEGLFRVISEFGPSAMAIEDVFTFRNPRSALKLAQARGVAVLSASLAGIDVFEYQPKQVKNSVCGYGMAEKAQVGEMAMRLLNITGKIPVDATDALAVAICHAGRHKAGTAAKHVPQPPKGKSWRSMTPADLVAMGFKIDGK